MNAFANEVSMLASEYDVDYTDVIGFANMHPRVNVLSPGRCRRALHSCRPWFLIYEIGRIRRSYRQQEPLMTRN